MAEGTDGIDQERVTPWLAEHLALVGPVRYELIAGGHSNLTYRVTDGSGRTVVLRRPPLGHVLATAHDMGREHRIISALGPTAVPVAPALAFCDDLAVNGAPFYVMGFVDGHVLRDVATAETVLPESARRAAGESLVDVLVDIHAVVPASVGLGDLGRTEGYIERQLNRWYRQYQASATREIPAIDATHERLRSAIPDQGPATIVHGDYRLDNCMVDNDGSIVAVLDWEICTLGDPLADVGLLMVYWADPDEDASALPTPSPTRAAGFPTRAELLDRYAERSGADLSGIDFYVAFGYWKLACIIEGVYARYRDGAMGEVDVDFVDGFGSQVIRLADAADLASAGAVA